MRIVICEDEMTYLNSLQKKIKYWQDERNINDIQLEIFRSSEDFLCAWDQNLSADLLLLDILFPNELDGMSIARHIRKTDTYIPIVFISNSESFLHEGYTVSALRYLSKPIKYLDLSPCLDIAYQQYKLANKNFLVIEDHGARIALRYSEIIYFEAQSPYVLIYKEKEKPIKIRLNFSKMASQLPSSIFLPTHRSYIVNIMHIYALRRNEILVSAGVVVPLSKKYYADVNNAFDKYYQTTNDTCFTTLL